MKIAVLSDSHDAVKKLEQAVTMANRRRCSHLLHLGDIISPYAARYLEKFAGDVTAVYGNCDGDKLALQRVFHDFGGQIHPPPHTLTLGEKRILLLHQPDLLDELTASGAFDWIFYGHLHERKFRSVQNTRVLNPGEVAGLLEKPGFTQVDLEGNRWERVDLS